MDRGPSSHPHPLGPSVAASLITLMVGEGRRLPNAFLRQGFHFNTAAEACEELRYGIVQNEGGPCGVLAAVQAMLIRQFIHSFFMITADVQRTVLARAFAEILLMAQPEPAKVVIVTVAGGASPREWPARGASFGSLADQRSFVSNQMGYGAAVGGGGGYGGGGGSNGGGFASRDAIEAFLLEHVIGHIDDDAFPSSKVTAADWCSRYGYGLLCLVFSLVLSKGGVASVKKEMDVSEQPLIVEHGYCTQEITNLVLTGYATSGVHDGVADAGGMTARGFLRDPMPAGHLSFLETLGRLTVGTRGKRPTDPVWVIYHESHYTVLFMREDTRAEAERAMHGGGRDAIGQFDLFFYDQQGGQDEEIRLSVTISKAPLPATRKDALVPYLNVIIRTVDNWGNARVNWNGTDPLL